MRLGKIRRSRKSPRAFTIFFSLCLAIFGSASARAGVNAEALSILRSRLPDGLYEGTGCKVEVTSDENGIWIYVGPASTEPDSKWRYGKATATYRLLDFNWLHQESFAVNSAVLRSRIQWLEDSRGDHQWTSLDVAWDNAGRMARIDIDHERKAHYLLRKTERTQATCLNPRRP